MSHLHLSARLCLMALLVFALAACGASDEATPSEAEGADPPADVPRSKDEARNDVAAGKADWSLDPCDWWGWYEDAECDSFCFDLDPACGGPRFGAEIDPETGLRGRYTLPGDDLFPESVAFDPSRRAFFVSGMSAGGVTRVTAEGEASTFYAGTGEADRATLGVKVDAERDRLLVCSLLNVDPPTGRVWIFDLSVESGGEAALTHDIDLTEAATHGSCNDMAVGPEGEIYVTDREQPHVYRISDLTDEGDYTLTLWANDPILDKPLLGIGQNGAAVTPDGKALLTTQYLPPALYWIDLESPEKVFKVDLSGSHPLGELLAGADGITFLGDRLYVAFGESLLELEAPTGDWRAAEYRRLRVDEAVASVTAADDQLYVLKSDVAKFILGGTPALPFELIRIDPADFDLY